MLKDLLLTKTLCCDAFQTNKKGVPPDFKCTQKQTNRQQNKTKQKTKKQTTTTKAKEKTPPLSTGPRCYIRWKRDGDLLFLQWLDNKPASFIKTSHIAARNKYVKSKTKIIASYPPIPVWQPVMVRDRNMNVSVGDRSDQYTCKCETLRKTHRWWKCLSFFPSAGCGQSQQLHPVQRLLWE